MILCAGQGTRLRPLTTHIPKCMVPVGGKPVPEHVIKHLRDHNITELIINLYYLPDVVINRVQLLLSPSFDIRGKSLVIVRFQLLFRRYCSKVKYKSGEFALGRRERLHPNQSFR